jgi:uncharacterized protein (DUF952 family)
MPPLKCAAAVDTVTRMIGQSGSDLAIRSCVRWYLEHDRPRADSQFGRFTSKSGTSGETPKKPNKRRQTIIRKPEQVRRIYKICPASAWREAERQGVYRGSADDARDGFIHFSTALQVAETVKKHFFGQTELLLIAVDAEALGEALRWEPSRNAELFPHLYGELNLEAVMDVLDMRTRPDGTHDIPELVP